MGATTFINMIQRVKDSVSKVPEKLDVMLPSELKPSSSILSIQLVMSQVHARLSCCKKTSGSYYEKQLQKEMTFARFQSPYHQRLHTQVTPPAVQEDMHKKIHPHVYSAKKAIEQTRPRKY